LKAQINLFKMNYGFIQPSPFQARPEAFTHLLNYPVNAAEICASFYIEA